MGWSKFNDLRSHRNVVESLVAKLKFPLHSIILVYSFILLHSPPLCVCAVRLLVAIIHYNASLSQVVSLEWCKGPDRGLPAPDVVFFLQLSSKAAEQRADYGGERYEKTEFQHRVAKQFELLRQEDRGKGWEEVDASKDIEVIHHQLLQRTKTIVAGVKKEIESLWM